MKKTKRGHFWKYLVGGASLTTFMFIFQACYGTSQDMMPDVYIRGKVVSSGDGNAISGIKIRFQDNSQYAFTDTSGNFGFYTQIRNSYDLIFEDADSSENGTFASLDTSIVTDNTEITLNIALDELQH